MEVSADVLRRVTLLAPLDEASLVALAMCMRVRRWPAGAAVFRAGDPGVSVLVVAEGTLVAKDGANVLNRMGVGEVIGEMAFLDPAPRSASVEAVTDVVAYELDQDAMDVLRRRAPAAVAAIVTMAIRDVTRRLRNLDERIERELERAAVPAGRRTP